MSTRKRTNLNSFDPSEGRRSKIVPITQVARQVRQRAGEFKQGTDNPQNILKFAWVSPELVFLNYERQRHPEPAHIKKINVKWMTEVMTPGQARKDSNGHYYALTCRWLVV